MGYIPFLSNGLSMHLFLTRRPKNKTLSNDTIWQIVRNIVLIELTWFILAQWANDSGFMVWSTWLTLRATMKFMMSKVYPKHEYDYAPEKWAISHQRFFLTHILTTVVAFIAMPISIPYIYITQLVENMYSAFVASENRELNQTFGDLKQECQNLMRKVGKQLGLDPTNVELRDRYEKLKTNFGVLEKYATPETKDTDTIFTIIERHKNQRPKLDDLVQPSQPSQPEEPSQTVELAQPTESEPNLVFDDSNNQLAEVDSKKNMFTDGFYKYYMLNKLFSVVDGNQQKKYSIDFGDIKEKFERLQEKIRSIPSLGEEFLKNATEKTLEREKELAKSVEKDLKELGIIYHPDTGAFVNSDDELKNSVIRELILIRKMIDIYPDNERWQAIYLKCKTLYNDMNSA